MKPETAKNVKGVEALVSLDFEQFGHKPSAKLQYRGHVDKFGNPRTEVRVIGARLGSDIEKVTPKSLARFISRGQTWSPFVFQTCPQWKRPRRVEGLFKSCQVFALDFDNNERIDQIVGMANDFGFEFNIIHHSFSSTKAHQKLRAIAFMDSEVECFDKARLLSTGLAYGFEADTQCIDVARLYFGSKPDSIITVNNDSVVPVSVVEKIAKEVGAEQYVIKGERNISKPDNSEWGDAKIQREILAKLTPSKRTYVKKKVLGILKDIETFDGAKGSRYECVWRNSSRLSRMPEVVGSAVYQWVLDSVEKNPYFSDWEWDVKSVVMSAIEWSSCHADEPV